MTRRPLFHDVIINSQWKRERQTFPYLVVLPSPVPSLALLPLVEECLTHTTTCSFINQRHGYGLWGAEILQATGHFAAVEDAFPMAVPSILIRWLELDLLPPSNGCWAPLPGWSKLLLLIDTKHQRGNRKYGPGVDSMWKYLFFLFFLFFRKSLPAVFIYFPLPPPIMQNTPSSPGGSFKQADTQQSFPRWTTKFKYGSLTFYLEKWGPPWPMEVWQTGPTLFWVRPPSASMAPIMRSFQCPVPGSTRRCRVGRGLRQSKGKKQN